MKILEELIKLIVKDTPLIQQLDRQLHVSLCLSVCLSVCMCVCLSVPSSWQTWPWRDVCDTSRGMQRPSCWYERHQQRDSQTSTLNYQPPQPRWSSELPTTLHHQAHTSTEGIYWLTTSTHLSLSGILPSHLNDNCRLVVDARERRLHSTASQTCVVTRTYSTFGDRAFAAAGPGLWNSLPSHLKEADLSYNRFRRSLKTFLFGYWGHGAV